MRITFLSLALVLTPAFVHAQKQAALAGQGVSAKALSQIRAVEAATLPMASPQTANDAGFAPVLGWIPTMGVHWVSDARSADTVRFDLKSPAQLMFSRINGKETLVGAAYAYLALIGDTTRPPSFDGNPPWHEHPNLAPEGHTLVMLHVWLVPSPDGPFAGHNPNLPFWALGLTPPDAHQIREPARNTRMRTTALAIGEVVDSAGLFPVLQRRNLRLAAQLAERRAQIRALIPELSAAQQANDWERWDRVADQLTAHWTAMRDAYLSFAPHPQARARMERLMTEMATGGLGAAGHHH
jgi:hypothetical protein